MTNDIHIAKLTEDGLEMWKGNTEYRNYKTAVFTEDHEKAFNPTSEEEAERYKEALEDAFPDTCFLIGHRVPTEKEKQ